MFRPVILFFALALAIATPAGAQAPAGLDRLLSAMRLAEVMEIVAEEGRDYGEDLRDEMFPGRGGERWSQVVARIYDAGPTTEVMTAYLAETLSAEQVSELTVFFASPLGMRITDLELTARRALADVEVEDTVALKVEAMRADQDPRLDLIDQYVEANDLIELNVASGMNANFAFYQGLVESGVLGVDLSDEDMLNDVWAQEPALRAETEDWLYIFLTLAYEPLSDEELLAYIDLSRSGAGRVLNHALFAGFDIVFRRISREMGIAAAQFMSGQDI